MPENKETKDSEPPTESEIGEIGLDNIEIDETAVDETPGEEAEKESDLINDFMQPQPQPEILSQRQDVKPFLEQEPIENLEQELQSTATQAQQTPTGTDEQGVFNAPQYTPVSSARDYTDKDYYEQPTDETYPERFTAAINPSTPRDFIMPASRTQFEETFEQVPRRLIQREDTMAWRTNEQLQDWNMDKEKYKTSLETRKKRDDLL